MPFKQFPTCHCHSAASLDTASTPEAFAAWEAERESGALTVTDHGTLAAARKIYDIAYGKKYKGKLTPILGLEAYFRDDNCPILQQHGINPVKKWQSNTGWRITEDKYEVLKDGKEAYSPVSVMDDYQKYFHLTMHFLDQAAYEKTVKLLSLADARAEKHGKERKPLFGWNDLEEIGAENVTFTSSCLIGMVQRHIAFGGRYDIAEAYYKKLRSIVKPGNLYIEMFPHVCDRNWDSAVVVQFEDGTEERFKTSKKLKTDKAYGKYKADDGVYADALVDAWKRSTDGHGALRAVMMNRKWVEFENPKKIKSVRMHEGFIMNECTAYSPDGDLQAPANKFVMHLAQKYGDKILISDDSHFVSPEDKIVQDVKLMQDGDWRFATSYHRMTSEEAWTYFRDVMKIEQPVFESWIDNSREWASRFQEFKFKSRKSLPTSFYPEDTLTHTMRLVQKHGRMDWRNPEAVARLRAEINLLHYNGTIDLLPYFFIDEEVCALHERMGLLTGPGRGSAAGLELAYVLGITHVEPRKYGLSMDRFMTMDRVQSGKLPDIDQDLPHRDILVGPNPDDPSGWLFKRFGDCVIQISTDMTVKLKSAVLDVHRIRAPDRRVPEDVAKLAHRFQQPPQGISDKDFVFGYDNNGEWVPGAIETDEVLIEYTRKFPDEWEIVQKCLGITRGKSRHACAFVIADEPVHNFIPLTSVGGVKVTQPTAAQVEAAGGLKMDFLVVNSLRDIGNCIRMIQARSGDTSFDWESGYLGLDLLAQGLPFDEIEKRLPAATPSTTINSKRVPLIRVVPHKGEHLDIWALPEDQSVFRSICEGDTESVFQMNKPAALSGLRHFNYEIGKEGHKAIDSIETLAAFTALNRPGPLDAFVGDATTGEQHNMLVEFAYRARGKQATGRFPILDRLFPETYGVIVFQEQLQKAFQEIAGTTGIEANDFRTRIGKKKMKEVIDIDQPIFMKGAVERIGEESARTLWKAMETFGQYGFNKSHAVCYVVIAYACAWLKFHYPLEWWTAVLRNAKKNEIDEKFWRHCGHLIDMPDISLSGDTFEIVNERIRAPLSLLRGLGPKAHEEIVELRTRYAPLGEDGSRRMKTIEDFCTTLDARRIALGSTVTKVVRGVPKTEVKRGRSSLNSGVMSTLIVSGAMDSLFPPDSSLLSKLQTYIDTNCRITGNLYKKTGLPKEKVDGRFISLTALQTYQMKKKVLPSFSMDLFPLVSELGVDGLEIVGNQWKYKCRGEWIPVLLASGVQHISNFSPWPEGQTMKFASLAHVLSYEKKMYQGNKERGVFLLDIEGSRWDLVHWPDRKTGKLPPALQQELAGSIALIVLSKWTEKKPFSIDEVVILQAPLGSDLEKTPPAIQGEDNDEN